MFNNLNDWMFKNLNKVVNFEVYLVSKKFVIEMKIYFIVLVFCFISFIRIFVEIIKEEFYLQMGY